MSEAINGFWLPEDIRKQILTPNNPYTRLSFDRGRPCSDDSPGAVSARWPDLEPGQWTQLIERLRVNRPRVPRGKAYWERMQSALRAVGERLGDPTDSIRLQALSALPGYTGYSEAMIGFTLGALDMVSLSDIPHAFDISPTWRCARAWEALPNLRGRLRLFPEAAWDNLASRLPGVEKRRLFDPQPPPDFVVGYGAGNVPGTALLIAFLAQATSLAGGMPPAMVIKNSRREPIFSPLVLAALEEVDADLVAATAVLVWDYEEVAVQEFLLSQADLVIAAASDETIAQIQGQLIQVKVGHPAARFHAHGHKVSFSAIGRQVLKRDLKDSQTGASLLEIITLLAGLDSVFWDQQGCLSARLHFVERGGDECFSALAYAEHLNAQLRRLAGHLPRGAWPRQHIHDRFDRYKALEITGQVRVFSGYDDEFVVVLDERELDPEVFYRQVNDCQGRVIVVHPVADLMEIPERYLRMLPAQNLQSLSVALGAPGEALSEADLRFAAACGARGVTAIRCVGRAAFPQLAYSWDGLIPLDLVHRRPAGRFTTIEFDQPYEQILGTYHLLLARAGENMVSLGA